MSRTEAGPEVWTSRSAASSAGLRRPRPSAPGGHRGGIEPPRSSRGRSGTLLASVRSRGPRAGAAGVRLFRPQSQESH